MTEISTDDSFMSVMQNLIEDESIEAIEVNYYHTGGSFVSAYPYSPTKDKQSYEFTKPANKSNRLSGEMGYLETNNPHIQVRRSNLFSRDTYEIIKISTPVKDKIFYASPYVSKYMADTAPNDNILEVIEHELSQSQVLGVSLLNNDPKAPVIAISTGLGFIEGSPAEIKIPVTSTNYNEAVRFLVKNSKAFGTKYSVNFVPYLKSRIEDTPISINRTHEYVTAPISQKIPVAEKPAFEDILGFLECQLENDDVELFYIEKMEATGIETVKIELRSGASVSFTANDGDLVKVEDYALKNKTPLKGEGFWILGQTQQGSGSRRMFKIRRLPVFSSNGDGTEMLSNVNRLFMNALKNSMVYRFSLNSHDADRTGEVTVFTTSMNDHRESKDYSFDLETLQAFADILKTNQKELEEKYNVSFTMGGDIPSISFRRNCRVDYKNLILHGSFTQEMFSFLSDAYRSGCNIMVQGRTGDGKTTFIRALYEGANDFETTALLDENGELLFASTADNFLSLRGSSENIAKTAVKIAPERIVIDSSSPLLGAPFMEKCAKAGIQMLATMHGSIERLVDLAPNEDFETPFDLEVELLRGKVMSINQITASKGKVTKTPLWVYQEGEFRKMENPSRSLRRKMEQNLEAAKKKQLKKAEEISTESDTSGTPLVSITPEEKKELMEAMNTIRKFMDKF
jgi:hypothetical protein